MLSKRKESVMNTKNETTEILRHNVKRVLIILLAITFLLCFNNTSTAYAAKGTHLSETNLTMVTGISCKVTLLTSSNKAISTSKIKFKSDNPYVASVTAKGYIHSKREGTATITATYKGKNYNAKVKVQSRLVPSKKSITLTTDDSQSIVITTRCPVDTITYTIEDPDIVLCKWGKWYDYGRKTKLTFTPQKTGKTRVKLTFKGDGGKTDFKYITVNCDGSGATTSQTKLLKRMAAVGLYEAYTVARYPSTLHLNSVTYDFNMINGYGESYDRMVLRCYAKNSLGGYGDIYIVVIRTNSNENYPEGESHFGYGYLSVYSHTKDPGMESRYYSNKNAVNAYKDYYVDVKDIPYD